jgi:hypothetical protein
MNLHYRTAEGSENVAVLKEGSVIHTPAGTIVGPIVAIWIANFPSKASETLQDTRPGPYGGGRYYLRWSSVLREKNPIRRFRLWRNEVEQSRDADP